MIPVAIHGSSGHRLATINDNTVWSHGGFHSKRGQAVCHHLDAITFLDAKLFGAAQNRSALSADCGNKQHGEFVDCQRNLILRDVDTLEFGGTNAKISDRLPANHTLFEDFYISPHHAQDVNHADSRRVHANVSDGQVGIRGNTRRNEEKR